MAATKKSKPTVQLAIRVSESDKSRWERAASKARLKITHWVVDALNREAAK